MAEVTDLLFVLLVFAAGVLCGAEAMIIRHRNDSDRIEVLSRYVAYLEAYTLRPIPEEWRRG